MRALAMKLDSEEASVQTTEVRRIQPSSVTYVISPQQPNLLTYHSDIVDKDSGTVCWQWLLFLLKSASYSAYAFGVNWLPLCHLLDHTTTQSSRADGWCVRWADLSVTHSTLVPLQSEWIKNLRPVYWLDSSRISPLSCIFFYLAGWLP